MVGRSEQEKRGRKEGEAAVGPTSCRAFEAMLGFRISLWEKMSIILDKDHFGCCVAT